MKKMLWLGAVMLAATALFAQGVAEQNVGSVASPKAETVDLTAAMNSEKYTSVVAQTLPDAEDMVIDLDDYYGQVLHGYYNYDCYVNENLTRTAKFYVPEHSVYNQPTVFIMVPAGVNTYGFLCESGWKDAADKYVFYVVLMETDESGKWGDIDYEMDYLSALRDDVSYRPFFCTFSSNFYAIAYGNCADALLKHAMANPNQWADVSCIGVTGVEDSFLESMKTKPSKEDGVMVADVAMPIFLVSEEKTPAVQKLIDYYKHADDVEPVQYSCSYADEVYIPRFWNEKEAMDDEPVAKVFYKTAPVSQYYQPEMIDSLYHDFMCKYYRYPGSANDDLRAAADINELGFKKYEAKVPGGFKADGSDQYNREWYVYVPETVDTSKPAPVVFDFHGAGGTGNEIAGRSGWIKTAHDRKCILVCPTGSHTLKIREVSDMTTNELFRAMWNTGDATEERPSDLDFVRWLYNWMCENYNVDKSRVYCTGQSSGGAMTHACVGKLSDIFTAGAAVSATVVPADYNESYNVPLLVSVGTKDPSFAKQGFGDKKARSVIDYWTNRYDTKERWSDYTYMQPDAKCSYVAGTMRNYVFHNQDGVPMLRCIENEGKRHAYWPSEAYMIWDEWFAQYTKGEDGTLYFQGHPVEIR